MPWALPVAIGVAGGLDFLGMDLQASAAKDAASAQAQAATQAAQIQAQSQQQALAFAMQQAQQNLVSQNAMQQANYNQWAAGQQRLSDVGQQAFGWPARNIPPYVPIPGSQNPVPSVNLSPIGVPGTQTAQSTQPMSGLNQANQAIANIQQNMGSPQTPTGTTAATQPGTPASSTSAGTGFPSLPTGGNPMDPTAISNALKQEYAALGVSPTGPGSGPTDLGYYANVIANTGGLTASNFPYWFGPSGRIASDLAKAGGATSSASSLSSPTGAQVLGQPGNSFLNYMLMQPGVTPPTSNVQFG